jgi:hypothetical protein
MFEGDDSFEDFGFEEELELKVKKQESRAKVKDCSIVFNLGSLSK